MGHSGISNLKKSDNEGKVDEILAINKDGSKDVTYWKRSDTRRREEPNIDSRDDVLLLKSEICGAPEGADAVFDKGRGLPVD